MEKAQSCLGFLQSPSGVYSLLFFLIVLLLSVVSDWFLLTPYSLGQNLCLITAHNKLKETNKIFITCPKTN